jgi:hypothetical protein
MTSPLERPAEKEKIPALTPESPVEVATEMTQEGVEAAIGLAHETAKRAVDELEGVVRSITGTEERTPDKGADSKPENRVF